MGTVEGTRPTQPVRGWRTVSEKRRIAELTFEPGASGQSFESDKGSKVIYHAGSVRRSAK